MLSLQQQTQDQLASLQTATEEALQQAAQVLLQELQRTAAPAELAAAAAQPGPQLCSDIDIELSLAALQQQSAVGLGLQLGSHAQGSEVPWSTASSSWWNAGDAAGGSAQHSSSDDMAQRHAAAGQHKATDNRSSSLDDTQVPSLQDQEVVFGHAAAAERHPVLCARDVGPDHTWPQTHLPQHGIQQWQECSAQPCAELDRTEQLRSDNAHSSPQGSRHSPPAPASVEEPATTGTTRGVQHLQLQARRSSCQLLPAVQLAQALQMALPRMGSSGGTGCAAARRCSRSSSSSEAGNQHDGSSMFATPLATPYHTMPWQPAGGQHSAEREQQQEARQRDRQQEHAVSSRQLRAVTSLPARQQGSSSSMQRSLRKCMSSMQVQEDRAPIAANTDHPAVLRCASGRRQQLETSWQQGLAKAAGQAASSSLHAGAAAAESLSTMRRRMTKTLACSAAGVHSGSDSDGSDAAGAQRHPQHAKRDWRSLARQGDVSVLAAAAAPARIRVAGKLVGPSRSTSIAKRSGGHLGSAALDLLEG